MVGRKPSVQANLDLSTANLIRIHGLSWSVNKKEIYEFFSGVNILNNMQGIHFISNEEFECGNAFIQLETNYDLHLAQSYHKQYMGERQIKSNY